MVYNFLLPALFTIIPSRLRNFSVIYTTPLILSVMLMQTKTLSNIRTVDDSYETN
jgi:hypothetical protein